MSSNPVLLNLFICSAPILSALIGIAFLWLTGNRSGENRTNTKLYALLTIYFSVVILNWFFGAMLIFSPRVVASLNGLVYCLLLIVQPILYHFIYMITVGPDEKRFSFLHYLFPVVMLVAVTVLSLQIQADVRTAIEIKTDGIVPDSHSYKYYSILTHSKSWVRLIYSLIYMTLGLYRVLHYRRSAADFTADAGNSSLGWILFFILLSFPFTLAPILLMPGNAYQALSSFRALLPALNMFIQIPVLCYFTAAHRYVLIAPAEEDKPGTGKPRKISREEFEQYLMASKPYLKADLQIADLCGVLKTNRSYLSSFINTTYGMNFSQLINDYRLRELGGLLQDPRNAGKNNLELIHRAGFGSYHAYYRAKKQQDKRTTLEN